MKTQISPKTRLPAAFSASPKFRIQIQAYRNTVRRRFSKHGGDRRKLIDLALNEAEALAWQTPFPQLLFPLLAEEKARAVVAWQARQDELRGQNEFALAV